MLYVMYSSVSSLSSYKLFESFAVTFRYIFIVSLQQFLHLLVTGLREK